MVQRKEILKSFRGFSDIDVWVRKNLQEYWAAEGPRGVLWRLFSLLAAPPAWIYSAIQRIRRFLFRYGLFPQRTLDAVVISVGGLRVGGSGKTPFTLWLADRLTSRGFKVVLLTRGYGRKRSAQPCQIITQETLPRWDPLECGDEPFLLARALPKVPVVVGANRYLAARQSEKMLPVDIYLLDDGFQHLALRRDCDIVLLPGNEDPATMSCLPRGPLREPASALRDADILVKVGNPVSADSGENSLRGLDTHMSSALCSSHTVWLKPAGFFTLKGARSIDLQILKTEEIKVFAFCGIARPETFWNILEKMGLAVTGKISYPDHYHYGQPDYNYLMTLMAGIDWMVTTEKDAVKLTAFDWPEDKILYLKIGMIMNDENRFWDRLKAMNILSL